MLKFANEVLKTIRAVVVKITYTKYLLGLITVGFTVLVLPLFRFISKKNEGNISKAADATYWVLTCLFGIGILVYPWWLATAKSPMYYSRLQFYGRIISIIILLLAAIQGIFNPDTPFSKNDPEHTTLTFRVISCFNIVALLGGLLIALPILIRRDRLFKSNSQALFRFAWLFTLVMIVGMILNRTIGYNRIVAYSCILVVVQFFVFDYLEAVERKRNGKVGIFDEAYIIVAGFVPFWIAFAVGGTLLEIVSQASSVGTVFVYISWRVIIYAFEYLSSEVGRKASRYSDGSVFAYSAIYTGAAFGNFIFLSVQWNSYTFWALLVITALNIVIVNGGLVIDMDYLFVDYFAVGDMWSCLHHLKVLYYELVRGMDHSMAVKIANCGAHPTPEVQLYLIRSRAKFLQINWIHNDIKMSSEFQALACACTAVGMEMVYSYNQVGADSITANSSDRRDLLYIFCVQVLFVFCAQAVARRRLRHKVSRLKREISTTVKALHSPLPSSSNNHQRVSTRMASNKPPLDSCSGGGGGDSGESSGSRVRRSSTVSTTAVSDSKAEHSTGESNSCEEDGHARLTTAPVKPPNLVHRALAAISSFIATVFGQCGVSQTTKSSAATGRCSSGDVTSGDVEMGGDDCSEEDGEADDSLLISDTEVDADALNAILGLCSLYAEDAQEQEPECDAAESAANPVQKSGYSRITSMRTTSPFAKQDSPTFANKITFVGANGSPLSRNRSDNRNVNFRDFTENAASENDFDEDDWEEVQLTNARQSVRYRGDGPSENKAAGGFPKRVSNIMLGSPRRGSTMPHHNASAVRMQGYLQKRKPGTSATYQRRFFILTNRQLMWFASEEDVEMHINRRKGAINVCNITHLDRYDPSSLCIVNVTVGGRVYILLAEDRVLADEWYDMMQSVRDAQRVEQLDATDGTAALDALPELDEENPMSTYAASASQPSARQSVLPTGFSNLTSMFGFDSSATPAAPSNQSSNNANNNAGSQAGRVLLRSAASTRLGLENFFSSVFADDSDTTELLAPEAWKESWNVQNLPLKAGYILKKGELNAQWQHRWFVLDGTGVLSWYEKAGCEEGQKPRGTLAVWEVSSIKPTNSAEPRLIVLLHIHGRVFELEACSELDATDWRHILHSWVSSARAAVEAYHSQRLEVRAVEKHSSEDAPSPSAHIACRKTGFLQKRGNFNTDWRRRWFELDHPGVLSWFDKPHIEGGPQKHKPKGSIQLKEVMCIKVVRRDTPCLIEVAHIQGRTYELLADSAVEAEEWRVQLNLWLREAYNIAKETQIGLRGSVAQAPASISCKETEPTEQADFLPAELVRDIESEKLEASKKRYHMYSKWGRAFKAKGLSTPQTEAFTSLSSSENNFAQKATDESKECPSPTQKEPFVSVTESIEALSKHHAAVTSIIANDPLAASEEPDASPVAATRQPFFMQQSTAESPGSTQDGESSASGRRHSASPGSLSALYSSGTNENSERDCPSPVLMLTENPHRKAAAARRGSTVQSTSTASAHTTPQPHVQSQSQRAHNQRAKRQNVLSKSPNLAKRVSGTVSHRDSDMADSKFMDRMGKRHSSELVDNLHKRSYKDINAEFWDTHLWYLACVVCFVTLNVLYTTSYIMTREQL